MLSSQAWIQITGLSGAAAVMLGAMGAHAFKNQNEQMKETWKVASTYHFLHTFALALSAMHFTGKKRAYVCTLFAAGTLFFSGACYTIVLMDQRKPFNYFAPVGGIMLMGGWLAFAFM
ncbi:DUF423 domain-containing protein [archaeon]|nr:MAG: DUF423 domain-containing protein [archaeon]